MRDLLPLLHRPLHQWLLFISVTLVVLLIIRPQKEDSLWVMAGVLYIGFILTNSAFIWAAERPWMYLLISFGLSIAYILVIAMVTTAYSKIR